MAGANSEHSLTCLFFDASAFGFGKREWLASPNERHLSIKNKVACVSSLPDLEPTTRLPDPRKPSRSRRGSKLAWRHVEIKVLFRVDLVPQIGARRAKRLKARDKFSDPVLRVSFAIRKTISTLPSQ